MTTHKWQFPPRFRRNTFGWTSQQPISRIKEAVSEIKRVARKDPVLGAEGAVLFLEKIAPAIARVDASSGAISTAVNHAIETLVHLIAKAEVERARRERWLQRLWLALRQDSMPYLELMGHFWGELCVTSELASSWADQLKAPLEQVWRHNAAGGHAFFKGGTACLSALYSAGRHSELLALLESAHPRLWHYRQWGAMALAAGGRHAEAIRYAEDSRGLTAPPAAIARFCERVLLDAGLADEAYARYALDACDGATRSSIFRCVVKKYPQRAPETILNDLVASQPGQEGKWFATAKNCGLFKLAVELAQRSATDPRTLIRASRDFALERPSFALAVGMTALRGIARGEGDAVSGTEVLDAYAASLRAAAAGGVQPAAVNADIRAIIAGAGRGGEFVQRVLGPRLG
jgi:hypothetical protein